MKYFYSVPLTIFILSSFSNLSCRSESDRRTPIGIKTPTPDETNLIENEDTTQKQEITIDQNNQKPGDSSQSEVNPIKEPPQSDSPEQPAPSIPPTKPAPIPGDSEVCKNYDTAKYGHIKYQGFVGKNGPFRHINRSLADVKSLDFTMTSLTEMDLGQVQATGTDFADSFFQDINMKSSDFTLANFSRAQLSRVDMSKSFLVGANFSEVHLSQLNLQASCASGSNFSKAVLAGGLDLSQSDFSEANFSSAWIGNGVNFKDAILRKANFSHAELLANVSFHDADLRGANFKGTKLYVGGSFDRADLTGAVWIDGRICGPNSIGVCR